MIILRSEIGDVLRSTRLRQGRTLREVSTAARVSLGYLSEVERGQKEASSELLSSICEALDVPLSVVLGEVSDRVACLESDVCPDTIPASLLDGLAVGGLRTDAMRTDALRSDTLRTDSLLESRTAVGTWASPVREYAAVR
jgi:transcriptional regulator with XRE-family HTH domain